MCRRKIGKRGSVVDLVLIAFLLFVFAFFILIGYKLSDATNDKIQSMSQFDTNAKNSANELVSYYPGAIDNSFLFVAIGLAIATLVMAFLVRIHPVFIALYFIILVILIFYCGIIANMYDELATNSQLSDLADDLTYVPLIMTYLPIIIGVFGTLLMIVMYKTWKSNE